MRDDYMRTERPHIIYVANARMPTEKAHGIAIMRACAGFVQAGAEVTLVIPRRFNGDRDIRAFYHIPEKFRVVRLPTIDFTAAGIPGWLPYIIQNVAFYTSLFFYLLFQSRSVYVYSRVPTAVLASFLGFRVFVECHHIPKRRRFFVWLMKRTAGIVVISHGLQSILQKESVRTKIWIEPSAVDPAIFDIAISQAEARARCDLPRDKYILMYTGNFKTFDEEKGIADCLKALAELSDEYYFVAVGGSANDCAYYEEMARSLGVAHRVRIIGFTPQSDMAVFQKAADVLMMPFPDMPHYRFHMSPIKMFEYMIAKRPIIASDLPTIREVLHDTNAVIVPPNNPQAIAQAITKTHADVVLAERLAAQAYQDVISRYTWHNRAERVLGYLSATSAD